MTNFDVCVCFVNGSKNGAHSLSMRISSDGSKIYSYGTVIGQKLANGSVILNETKYSVTTSIHQSHLRYALTSLTPSVVVHHTTKQVPIGTYDLYRYTK